MSTKLIRIALVYVILAYTGLARAEGAQPPAGPQPDVCEPVKRVLRACDLALTACQDVVAEQDRAIENLRGHVNTLQDKLSEATKPAIVPTWVLVAGGVVTGLLLGVAISK